MMVRVSQLHWGMIQRRLADGETITNGELANAIEHFGLQDISGEVRVLVAARLRLAQTPGARGRPRRPNASHSRALNIYNRVNLEWARLGGKRGQKKEAIKQAAATLQLTINTVEDALANDAPSARRRYPYLAFTVEQWVEALARHANEHPQHPE